MKNSVLRFCAGLLAAVLLSMAVVPCYAVSDKYTSTGTFWQAVADKWYFNGTFIPAVIGTVSDKVCSESGDKKHHGSLKSYEQNSDKSYTAICDFCSAEFPVYDADLSAAYDNYVETFPAPGYTSAGRLIWQPTAGDLDLNSCRFYNPFSSGWASSNFSVLPYENGPYRIAPLASGNGLIFSSYFEGTGQSKLNIGLHLYYKAPISGSFGLTASPKYSVSWCLNDGTVKESFGSYSAALFSHFSAGDTLSTDLRCSSSLGSILSISSNWYFPVYEVIPDTALSADTYNTNTRPTSISGGNYGIVGDNGQITKVEDNSTIINETNNTFYNPATGTTVPIVNWSYDYSDRSYKVTLESGDTATITYGDENITIQETTITEGDTITNNYTIYYLIDGSGSVTPPCEHDWQEASGTDPTCTLPGKVTLSCAKCQQTKTETLPALGHDWQVKQTVITEYDDTGQLVQQGYTIFECSRCHEQYKSPDGTIPPGGGSGTDPGGEEEDEGFLSWLLGKLGELLGTIGDGILNLLQTALDKIFGGLIDLVNSLFENLAKLVDLFGTVGEAFQVLWTWLPPEIIAILVAGVSIFVFLARLKFFMK